MTEQKATNKGRIIFIFLIIIIVPAIWFLFLNKDSDVDMASEKLAGSWLRSDGTYTITISDVKEDGIMKAAYNNPKPIHVEKALWNAKDDVLQVYVEMNDENYRGSYYKLTYDEQSDQLIGSYYQAVSRQTYDVYFTKDNKK